MIRVANGVEVCNPWWARSFLWSAALIVILSGCGGDNASGGDACSDAEPCAEGKVCVDGTCVKPSTFCDNGIKDGNETGIDCGGSCDACPVGEDCAAGDECQTGVCDGTCQASTCADSVQNGDETGVDCGGECVASGKPCAVDFGCQDAGDCQSGICGQNGQCAAPSCTDAVKNGDETAVDCGGSCANCEVSAQCQKDADCASGVCSAGVCRETTCSNQVRDGDETGVDCGGSCGSCVSTGCTAGSECASGVCLGSGKCAEPSCDDSIKNGDETGADCGGRCVGSGKTCSNGTACSVGTDCASGVCEGTCKPAAPHCGNAVVDQSETGLDCGGVDCDPCGNDFGCTLAADCQSGVCGAGNICTGTSLCVCQAPTCQDGVKNGTETFTDCGGSCVGEGKTCAVSVSCTAASDCQSGVCNVTCQAPSCEPADGVKNGTETGVDCGGTGCPDCDTGGGCDSGADCQSGSCGVGNTCTTPPCTCQGPTCSDGVKNGTETFTDCGGSCVGEGKACAVSVSCTAASDCQSGVCNVTCQAPSCEPADGVKNGTETGVDCGGAGCPDCGTNSGCNTGADCLSGACGVGNTCTTPPCACQAPTCLDGVKNGTETDIDCGGSCVSEDKTCDQGELCAAGSDCQSGSCDVDNTCTTPPCTCQIPTCSDGVKNGTETDIDCGGTACVSEGKTCAATEDCAADSDCRSGLCDDVSSTCQYGASCVPPDGIKNGTETDTDCGGSSCPGCGTSGVCNTGGDCDEGVCGPNNLCPTPPCTCQAPTCSDGVLNQDEHGIDCAGVCLLPANGSKTCPTGTACDTGAQCQSGFCNGECMLTSCEPVDAIKNGDETGVDCGGNDCPSCPNGQGCALPADCQSGICGDADATPATCTTLPCACKAPACGDGVKNGTEPCDGTDLAGQTCLIRGFVGGGALACNSTCTDFDTTDCSDILTCTPACTSGKECVSGVCTCPQGTVDCNGTCVSSVVDPDNCGGCGLAAEPDVAEHICAAGEACSAGVCVSDCQAPLVECDRRCVDTLSDNTHCGGCPGTTCTLNQVCNNGECEDAVAVLNKPAKCISSGPPIVFDTLSDTLDCAGDLASVTFRWGVCTCDDMTISQGLITDGYDSSQGPYDPLNPGAGAGAGTNGAFSTSGASIVRGALWASRNASLTTPAIGAKKIIVSQGFYCGGPMSVTGGTFTVPVPGDTTTHTAAFTGDSYAEGNISVTGNNNITLTGDLYQTPNTTNDSKFIVNGNTVPTAVDIANPCDCSTQQRIDVAAVVETHACDPVGTNGCSGVACCTGKNNDNAAAGLNPAVFNPTSGRLDIDCGHYYFRGINPAGDTAIHVRGNTAIYVEGDIYVSGGKLTISLDPTARLDIFLTGGMCGPQKVHIGSANYPSNLRVYIGNPSAPSVSCGGSSINFNQAVDFAGNFYAPYFPVSLVSLSMYGSLFAKSVKSSQPVIIHYDRAVVDEGETCVYCGNGRVDPEEACDGELLNGHTCVTEGFTGGLLACTASCTLNTAGCYLCGDGVKEGTEECEPPGASFALCSAYNRGTGNVACTSSCQLDFSGCQNISCNHDGSVAAGEECDQGNPESDPDLFASAYDTCQKFGYAGGALTCNADCTVNTSGCYLCGDGIKNGTEQCDGTALGGATCTSLGYPAGTLGCAPDCTYDVSNCGGCVDCRDCNNQACVDGACGACVNNSDCCAPFMCFSGVCKLLS